MKRVICDTCRKEGEPDQYGSAPEGWIDLMVRSRQYNPKNYCSAECATQALASAPPLSAVEQTIHEADRLGMEPASLV